MSVAYTIEEKHAASVAAAMLVLHEYPGVFIHGLFDGMVEDDLRTSDLLLAREEGKVVGCLLFNRTTNELNWLGVSKSSVHPRREIARGLFEAVERTVPPGTELRFFVNTEDASYPGHPEFSGRHSEPARRLYRDMGWVFGPRIENKFGPGAHAYPVSWIVSNP